MSVICITSDIDEPDWQMLDITCGCCLITSFLTPHRLRAFGTAAELRAAGWCEQALVRLTSDEAEHLRRGTRYGRVVSWGFRYFGDVEHHRSCYVCPRCESLGRVMRSPVTGRPYRAQFFIDRRSARSVLEVAR